MKNLIICLILILCTILHPDLNAQWTDNGSQTTTTRKVGIKTTDVASFVDLDVHGLGRIRATSTQPIFELFDDDPSEDKVVGEFSLFGSKVRLVSYWGDLEFRTGISGSSIARMLIRGSTGDVGIGTTNPSQKLDVNGAIELGSTTIRTSGTIRYNGINFQGFHNGTWKNLDKNVWGTNGTSAHYLSGKVGIGTSLPQVDLEVQGGGDIRARSTSPSLSLYDTNQDRTVGIISASDDFKFTGLYSRDFQFTIGDAGFTTDTVVTIKNIFGGRVGIGTVNPTTKFHVDGPIKIGDGSSSGDRSGMIRYNGTNFQGHHNGIWQNLDSQSLWNLNGTTTHYTAGKVGIGTTSPSAELHIKTLPGQNGMNIDIDNQRAMHVSGNRGVTIGNTSAPPATGLAVTGDAGIGTNSPSQKLDVVGAIKIGTTTNNVNGSIRYDGTNFQGHTGGTWVNLNGAGGGGGSVWTQSGADATYTTGNVGIGTTSPTHLLHVAGDLAVAGSVVAPSDYRLKDNIQPITEAMSILDKLQPKKYSYKTAQVTAHGLSDKQQYGLIAQELAEVLPTLVTDQALVDADGNSYKGIEYAQLIPILTQAIKELSAENKELKTKQTTQTALLTSISSRLSKLEASEAINQNADND